MGNRKPIYIKTFFISVLYVGLGTVSVLGMYPESPIYWEQSFIGFLITFPVSVLSFGIAYMESENYELVLLVQLGMFFLFWFILYRIMLRRQKKK